MSLLITRFPFSMMIVLTPVSLNSSSIDPVPFLITRILLLSPIFSPTVLRLVELIGVVASIILVVLFEDLEIFQISLSRPEVINWVSVGSETAFVALDRP